MNHAHANLERMTMNCIKQKIQKASMCLNNLQKCKSLFEELKNDGYEDEAKCLREIIFLTAMIHPDWDDYKMLKFLLFEFTENVYP